MARELGVDRRTVKRWVDGTSPLPDWIATRLYRLLSAKVRAIMTIKYAVAAEVSGASCEKSAP